MAASLRLIGLFLLLIAIFVAIGWLLGTFFIGNWIVGALIFLILAALLNAVSYFFSSKIVLWSYRARIVSEKEAPRLHKIVRKVSSMAGLPMPQVAIVPTHTPNAFATGRNPRNAVVAATEGILTTLNDDELLGVMAHEMAHIKDRDILVMSVAATIAGAIAFMARSFWFSSMFGGRRNRGNELILLIVAITAPIAALLIQLAISRSREYKADRVGALTIHKPNALADALLKLEAANRRRPIDRGNPASSSLFIVNPFGGGSFIRLFSTHPPIEERVRRLRQLALQTVSL